MNASTLFLKVLLFALLPTAAMCVGGIAALIRTPGAAWRSAILHFAGGVVFSVVAVELLPDVISKHRPIEVGIGFGLGVLAMLLIRRLTRGEETRESAEAKSAETPNVEAAQARQPTRTALPVGLLTGVAVDIAVDGLLLGIGFAAGAKEGILLALALTVEILALGLATATELTRSGLGRGRTMGIVSGLSGLFLLFAVGGATLLHSLSQEALELVLSFGVAALLFLVTEELLVEAHEEPESPLLTATFFAGFLAFLLLGMVA